MQKQPPDVTKLNTVCVPPVKSQERIVLIMVHTWTVPDISINGRILPVIISVIVEFHARCLDYRA